MQFGPFGEYVIPWYGRELIRLETAVAADDAERKAMLARVEDMATELDDLTDEGYGQLSAAFDEQYDARARLSALRTRLLRPGDDVWLRTLDRADRLTPPVPATPEYGEPVPLEDYLDHLCGLTSEVVDAGVARGEAFGPWRDAAREILREQAAFADAARSRGYDGWVCLLRDMLPQYLIARQWRIPAAAVPLGRTYLDRFGPDYEAYDHITGALYGALTQTAEYERLWSLARETLGRDLAVDPVMAVVADALLREAGPRLPAGRLLVLETGLQATMPLLLGTVLPQAGEWFMYAAAPWLQQAYAGHVFRSRYTCLRPCETLACTDTLFTVYFSDHSWQARETLDPVLKARAYWEIVTLRGLAD